MTLSQSDISFTFSGGSSNSDPAASLGGESSTVGITGARLFDDVTQAETVAGMIDYRCFYLHNLNNLSTLYDSAVEVSYTVPGDVTVELGFSFQNERQNVTVTNVSSITSGSFTLSYSDNSSDYNVVVNWDSTLSNWATNFQDALRDIANLETVVVTGITSGTSVIFEVDFVGNASYRSHQIMVLSSNDLVGGTHSISIVKSVDGGPMNQTAGEIDVSTTTPNGIEFVSIAASVGDFRPLDKLPVWVKRIVPAGSPAIENDGFTFRITGDPVV